MGWWQQANAVDDSLISEKSKNTPFLDSIKVRSAKHFAVSSSMSFVSTFMPGVSIVDTKVQAIAQDEGRGMDELKELRDGYVMTLDEVRKRNLEIKFKMCELEAVRI